MSDPDFIDSIKDPRKRYLSVEREREKKGEKVVAFLLSRAEQAEIARTLGRRTGKIRAVWIDRQDRISLCGHEIGKRCFPDGLLMAW